MFKKDLELLKLILDFAKPYKKVLFASSILLPLSSIAFSIQPFLIQKAIDGPLRTANYQELTLYIYAFIAAIVFNFLALTWRSLLRHCPRTKPFC